MPTHVVTGASGFLGALIVKKLHTQSESVVAFDTLAPQEQLPGIRYLTGDVRDEAAVRAACEGADYVYHTAALVPLTKAGEGFQDVNVRGTRTVVNMCRALRIKKLVHLSSSAIYGLPDDMPITDRTPYHPIEIYGQSKLDAEKEVWKYQDEGGAASCIRPRTIIGGTGRLGIFQILFQWVKEGRNIYVIGNGNNQFQFVHVDDLIDATLKAATATASGRYNIGSDNWQTLRQDLDALIKHAGTKSRVVGLPVWPAKLALHFADFLRLSPLAPWHYLTYHKPFVFNTSAAKRDLGWTPKHTDVEALIESYDWFLAHGQHLSGESTHTKPVKESLLFRLIRKLS